MYNYHSALGSIKSQFEFYRWDSFIGRDFCVLLPFDRVLNSKFRVSSKRVDNMLALLKRWKSVVPDIKFMLDCGAFSAWRNGFEIDVQMYIEFIKSYGSYWESIVALDKINNPEGTLENCEIMRKSGIENAIPVYHVGEPDKFLVTYTSLSDYVGFSPPFGLKGDTCIDVYQAQLYNVDGSVRFPDIKFHGFGVGAPIFFQVYPWYSCDSSTSDISARFGSVTLYSVRNDIIYAQKLFVSEKQKKQELHYDYLNNAAKNKVDALFSNFGFSIRSFDETLFPEDIERKYVIALVNRISFCIFLSNAVVSRIPSSVPYLSPSVRLL